MFSYTVTDHPTRRNAVLATIEKSSHIRCDTVCEDAFNAIGGNYSAKHSRDGRDTYVLSAAQARDLDVILRHGFQPYPQGEGWFRDDLCEPDSTVPLDLTRADALAIIGLPQRCPGTLELAL